MFIDDILIYSKSKEDHEIAKPLASLTQKNQKYEWGREQEEAFQTLKDNLCNAPIMSLPNRPEDFVVYCDTSNQGLGCVLMQRGKIDWTGISEETTDKGFLEKRKAQSSERSSKENLKKCLADANLHVPIDEIMFDKTLRFVEEPVEIMDREVKNLKRSKIPIVKVRWNSNWPEVHVGT
ncbi:putative reverse transcriptase domain-containing protein [Tanacetum coccineum]|uniref:Reverse transcriptase domain-containing protein n=1 Tax=Tanacetum coccineum TaxID=301880 RepID=A0ABQ5B5U4_9ASTR